MTVTNREPRAPTEDTAQRRFESGMARIVVLPQRHEGLVAKAGWFERLAAFADKTMDFLRGDLECPALTEREASRHDATAETYTLKFSARGRNTPGKTAK